MLCCCQLVCIKLNTCLTCAHGMPCGTHHVNYYNSHTQSYFKVHTHTYCGPCTHACMHTNILNCLRSSLPQHHCRRTQLRMRADALSSGRVQTHSALDMCQHMQIHAQRLKRAYTCRNMECPQRMKIHTKPPDT
jgi:hypothetical protein